MHVPIANSLYYSAVREAYPGDIFYIHSRLLERATHLLKELGGGSLTALPIIETEAQNISAYIPTNLISITDGQIYLSPSLFELGILPAVDVGKSVSRVGGKAQHAAYRGVAGDLKLAYSQFEELEAFTRFGARIEENTLKIIEHGKRIRALLKQPEFSPVSMSEQIFILLALNAKLFDNVPLDQMKDAEHSLRKAVQDVSADVHKWFDTNEELSDKDSEIILEIASVDFDLALAGDELNARHRGLAAAGGDDDIGSWSDHEMNPYLILSRAGAWATCGCLEPL